MKQWVRSWAENYNEVVLFVNEDNSLPIDTLYQLGLITDEEYKDIANSIEEGEEATQLVWDYEEVLNHSFHMLTSSDRYIEN